MNLARSAAWDSLILREVGMPNLELQIRRRLANCVGGGESLSQLEDWLLGTTWPDESCDLAGSVMLILSEYDLGHRSGEDAKIEFRRLLRMQRREIGTRAANWRTSSATPVMLGELQVA